MKTKLDINLITLALLALANLIFLPFHAQAQGTAFTYQGRLNNAAGPANGSYDLTFTLFNLNQAGVAVAGPLTNSATVVSNGLFTTTVDFGAGVFTGISSNWLEIAVRTNGSGTFSTLTPRQQLTPTPYAVFAESANAAGLSGSVPPNGLSGQYGSPIALVNAGNTIYGDGHGLTGVNAATLGGLGTNNFWQTGGNVGTTAGLNYLGTSDNQPVELHVNTQRAFRVEPTASVPNLIGGYSGNAVDNGAAGVTIGGGGTAGFANHISSTLGTVAGGSGNVIGTNANDATIGGGRQNMIDLGAWGAFIGGGHSNWIQTSSSPGGGSGNSSYSTIPGGYGNTIGSNSDYSTIGGGSQNAIQSGAMNATIAGGVSNTISGHAVSASIGGGANNYVNGAFSTVSGGVDNQAIGDYATVAGGFVNLAVAGSSTVGGGIDNHVYGETATVGGGYNNYASGNLATVGGGYHNEADGTNATVGGGLTNTASGNTATVSGGQGNLASGISSFVGGGGFDGFNSYGNIASGVGSVIGGGLGNQATNYAATVPGGADNLAGGAWSFAAGFDAQALHQGAFVWADSQIRPFASTTNDQFCIRARGGVQLDPTTSLYFGAQARQMLNLYSNSVTCYALGVQNQALYFRCGADVSGTGFAWYRGGQPNNNPFNNGGGTTLMTLTASGLIVSGTINSSSDRNVKQDFAPVDSRAVLEKVAQMPVQTWAYKQDPGTKHLGPMAQDFYAAFNIGPDDKHIATVDEGGVALAAIQGLNDKLEARSQKLEAENAELKHSLAELKQLVQSLAEKK